MTKCSSGVKFNAEKPWQEYTRIVFLMLLFHALCLFVNMSTRTNIFSYLVLLWSWLKVLTMDPYPASNKIPVLYYIFLCNTKKKATPKGTQLYKVYSSTSILIRLWNLASQHSDYNHGQSNKWIVHLFAHHQRQKKLSRWLNLITDKGCKQKNHWLA